MLKNYPYFCSYKSNPEYIFVPTIIDYARKRVWEQNSPREGDGDWVDFSYLKFHKNKQFEL